MFTRAMKVSRAEILEKAIKSGGLTPDGADWLTLRLDPYHDFNRPIAGYPDSDSYDTIVSINNYELNVTKPAAAAANWDAHIFTLPFTHQAGMHLGTFTGLSNFVEADANFNMGLVNIAKADAGQSLYPVANPVVATNFTCEAVNTFAAIEAGMSRVIGMGIEIIDTSADLYKQGSLCAYQMPTVTNTEVTIGTLNHAGDTQTNGNYHSIFTPPSTVAEAVLYRSSRQWEAKEGCYMVVGQEGVNNPLRSLNNDLVTIRPNMALGAQVAINSALLATTAVQVPPLVTSAVALDNSKMVNVGQCGIIMSGLNNAASFKIKVRVYVERAPMRGETDLIPLATPSAPYDPAALALYSKLISELPIAVPVGFNAHGDWWRMIVNVIKKVVPIAGTVLTPFFGPEAGMIGSTVGALIPEQRLGVGDREREQRRIKQADATVKRITQQINAINKARGARPGGPVSRKNKKK